MITRGGGDSPPRVLLDAAVIVGLEVREAALLKERMLLEVEAGRIDVSRDYAHTLGYVFVSYAERDKALLPVVEEVLAALLYLVANAYERL